MISLDNTASPAAAAVDLYLSILCASVVVSIIYWCFGGSDDDDLYSYFGF